MSINPMSVLSIMLLLHLIADYSLQGCLATMKQKSWWDKCMEDVKPEKRKKYRHDYIAALVCHSLYWALMISLPLVMFDSSVYFYASIINAAIHYVIDDMKANKGRLNLVWDQILHYLQILGTWVTYIIMDI